MQHILLLPDDCTHFLDRIFNINRDTWMQSQRFINKSFRKFHSIQCSIPFLCNCFVVWIFTCCSKNTKHKKLIKKTTIRMYHLKTTTTAFQHSPAPPPAPYLWSTKYPPATFLLESYCHIEDFLPIRTRTTSTHTPLYPDPQS